MEREERAGIRTSDGFYVLAVGHKESTLVLVVSQQSVYDLSSAETYTGTLSPADVGSDRISQPVTCSIASAEVEHLQGGVWQFEGADLELYDPAGLTYTYTSDGDAGYTVAPKEGEAASTDLKGVTPDK